MKTPQELRAIVDERKKLLDKKKSLEIESFEELKQELVNKRLKKIEDSLESAAKTGHLSVDFCVGFHEDEYIEFSSKVRSKGVESPYSLDNFTMEITKDIATYFEDKGFTVETYPRNVSAVLVVSF